MHPAPFGTCAHCGDRIGVYEPIVVVAGNAIRTTSIANEPQLSDRTGVILMHEACASAAGAR